MVATGCRIDRGLRHLAPGNHQHVLVETVSVQVFDQSGYSVVEQRQLLPHAEKVRGVPIPAAESQRDAPRPLDQPPCHEQMLRQFRAPR